MRLGLGSPGRYAGPLAEVSLSLAIGLAAGAAVLAGVGADPARGIYAMFSWALSDPSAVLDRATPILLTGLGFAVAARASLFNIGMEGQMYLGGLVALVVSLATREPVLPTLAGVAVGAGYGALAGILKVYRGVNEVVSTIMLNWIAYFLLGYFVTIYYPSPQRPWRSLDVPVTARFPRVSELPTAFLVAVAAALVMLYLLWWTSLGYDIRAVGLQPKAARYGGADPRRVTAISMALSGGVSGLAGVLVVLGRSFYLDSHASVMAGMGFDGIGVALVGRNHPVGIVLSSALFALMAVGGHGMQLEVGVPRELVEAVTGVVIFALAVPEAYRMLASALRFGRGAGGTSEGGG